MSAAGTTSDVGRFTIVPEWLLNQNGVSGTGIALYCVLGLYADYATGKAHPSRKLLAERLGQSVSTVDRCLKELERVGAVSRFERFTPKGDRDTNGYHLHRVSPQVEGGAVTSEERGLVTSDEAKSQNQFERETPSPATPSSAKRNIVWDVLAEHFGQPATVSERSDFGKTVKEIRAALMPFDEESDDALIRSEIGRRVEAMGDFRSHRSLRNRWGALGAAAAPAEPARAEVDERSAARTPCECTRGSSADLHAVLPPDPLCPDCGGTGIADWVS